MADDIVLQNVDHARIKILCENGILKELSERYTFEVPGAKFMPSYRNKYWDGKVRLINSRNHTTYSGLTRSIIDWSKEHKYIIDDQTGLLTTENFSLDEAQKFCDTLNLPFPVRAYQLRAFALAVRHRRCVLVSPTGSGKSLIAYLIARYYNKKILIIVPTTSLVLQLIKDFQDYGYKDIVHGVMAGIEKTTNAMVTVSTWQSMYEQDVKFFEPYRVVIADEAHTCKAKSLISLMTKMKNTEFRFGMTGTLDGAEVNELLIEGLFGQIEKIVQTSTLMDEKSLAELKIKILVLKHDKETRKRLSGCEYHEEIEFIIQSDARNKFVRNLAISLTGNTLVLYAYVEKHGKLLFDMIKEKTSDRNIHFVSGEVNAINREDIRAAVENDTSSIIVASFGTYQQGINLKNLHNIIFASPTKSRIRTLQSIGRGLRRSETKEMCKLFDIADDLSYNNKRNYTLNHLIERVKMYNTESFSYDMHNIDIRNSK